MHWSVSYYVYQFSSVTQSCPTLCDPMNCSTPGLPVHHHLLEFTQTHVHRVHDAIQPSHPRSSPSPLAPNPSQHQSLFQSVNSHKNRPWERSKTRSLRKQKPISTGYKVSGKGNWKEMWFDLIAAGPPPEKTDQQPDAVCWPVKWLKMWTVVQICPIYPYFSTCSIRGVRASFYLGWMTPKPWL